MVLVLAQSDTIFIHSFIHSKICIAPLQGNYSEALPTLQCGQKGRF